MTAKAEQETTIRWDEAEKVVHLWSASPLTWRKMARLGFVPVKETRYRDGSPAGKFYRLPLAGFRWGKRRGGVPGVAPRGFALRNPAPRRVETPQNASGEPPEAP